MMKGFTVKKEGKGEQNKSPWSPWPKRSTVSSTNDLPVQLMVQASIRACTECACTCGIPRTLSLQSAQPALVIVAKSVLSATVPVNMRSIDACLHPCPCVPACKALLCLPPLPFFTDVVLAVTHCNGCLHALDKAPLQLVQMLHRPVPHCSHEDFEPKSKNICFRAKH